MQLVSAWCGADLIDQINFWKDFGYSIGPLWSREHPDGTATLYAEMRPPVDGERLGITVGPVSNRKV